MLRSSEPDAEVTGGVAQGTAGCPLDEQDGSGPAHGRGPAVAEASEVLVVPVLFQERGDVPGAVAAGPGWCPGAVGSAGPPAGADSWLGRL